MLRTAINKIWKQNLTNKELYGKIYKIKNSIREQCLRFAGHCWRSNTRTYKRVTSLAFSNN